MPPIESMQTSQVQTQVSFYKRKIVLVVGGVVALLVVAFVFISTHSPSKMVDGREPMILCPMGSIANYTTGDCENKDGTAATPKGGQSRYLAFQLFTDTTASKELHILPPLQKSVKDTVRDIVTAIGTPGNSSDNKLGFIVGPLAFDNTDDAIRSRIQDSFAVALQQNVAVGFHIDDSMFWGRLSNLNTINNIEWLDWNKTPNTGRRLDWSETPTKIMPQLCVNSPAVVAEIKKRAALIGEEVQKGLKSLKAAGKEDLFIGVIAGWETQMGRDIDTGKYLGYCALTNKGYSAKNPPSDIDEARVEITKEFIDLWTASLASAGVPDAKIYSHIAFMPQINFDAQHASNTYTQAINFAPQKVAFGAHRQPGFSTYPGSFKPEDIKEELAKNGNPPWISAEGTALDPAQASSGGAGDPMEPYLASFFNHGAVLVTIFGWGVGPAENPFRRVAEGSDAIKAYRKFLSGESLSEVRVVTPGSSGSLQDKVHKIQANIGVWAKAHSDQQASLTTLSQQLEGYIKAGDIANANKVADTILKIIGL